MSRRSKSKLKLGYVSLAGIGSVSILGLLVLAMILPMSSSNTNALDNAMDIAETRVKVKAAASVSLALADQVELDITPSSAGSFASASTRLSVTTNNPEGYKLFLSTKNGNNALLGAATEISSITSDKTGNEFSQEGDVWGYSLTQGETTPDISSIYHQVPTTATLAYDQDTATTVLDEHHYNLGFGVHVTPSLLAGEYSNSVVVSVVANPNTITRLDQLVYMQDMTSAICEATPSAYNHDTSTVDRDSPYYLEPVTKQLYDIRDGNMYWVAKLADGNCWMTQNLALNLGERPIDAPASYSRYVKTLTPGDSDVTGEWTVPISSTTYRTNPNDPTETTTEEIRGTEVGVPHKETNKDGGSPDAITLSSGTRSWNLGKLVQINPTNSIVCKQETVPENLAALGYVTEHNASLWYGQAPVANYCTRYQSVDDLIPSNKVIATKDNSIIGNEYDAHYLLGNYYQWSTATAQTELITTEIDKTTIYDASGSICPKGWRLPATGVQMTEPIQVLNRDKSPYQLLYAYGYPSYDSIGTDPDVNWKPYVGSLYTKLVGGSRTRIDFTPTYFMHTGTLSPLAGNIVDFGGSGFYRTSTLTSSSQDKTDSVYFDVNPYSTYPAASRNKALGLAIRCLAR